VTLRAPFPWFGGKSRVAPLVWERFGDVPNYVEPFAGSLAVLLGRPHAPRTETVNDRDAYLSNFWRALQADPDGVAAYADAPVNEADLHARHLWLLQQRDFRERMLTEPDYFDVKVAGWWVWGVCAWIGSGWCATGELRADGTPRAKLPHLGEAGRGGHRARHELADYLAALSDRLRYVRVACGDWTRVLGDSVTWRHGTTAVFLDPPYDDDEHAIGYAGGGGVSAAVRAWALENGDHPGLRIALCGYEGEHAMPDAWACVPWKAKGGYGSQGDARGRENAARERVWFSPHCLRPEAAQPSLFGGAA
jgi:DNA adenine methylase